MTVFFFHSIGELLLYTHTHANTHTQIHTNLYIHTHPLTYICKKLHINKYTHSYTYIQNIHRNKHTFRLHTHKHTHIQTVFCNFMGMNMVGLYTVITLAYYLTSVLPLAKPGWRMYGQEPGR